ncbi:hypothetical protein PG984_011380 [Apiospora sp. TS-2023a]
MACYQARLNQERERLQKKLDQVNKTYDALLRRNQLPGHVGSPSTPRSAGQREATPKATNKSYLQPTTASLSRAKGAKKHRSYFSTKTPYKSGLTTPPSPFSSRFMRHTASSIQKIEGGGATRPETPRPWSPAPTWGPSNAVKSAGDDQSDPAEADEEPDKPPPPIVSQEDVALLAEQTRLEDVSWEDLRARHAVIPSEVGYWLLHEAYSLIQEVFHDFCKKHQPLLWHAWCAGGPRELHFESYQIGRYARWWDIQDIPIWSKLDDARDLRNELCHFAGTTDILSYEMHIKKAQRFAVGLNDAPRAARLRALRDGLRNTAAEALLEIENLGCLAIAPIGHYWEAHHEEFIRTFRGDSRDGVPLLTLWGPFSPAIEMAIEAWTWQQETQGSTLHFLVNNPDPDSEGQEQHSASSIAIQENYFTALELRHLRDGWLGRQQDSHTPKMVDEDTETLEEHA